MVAKITELATQVTVTPFILVFSFHFRQKVSSSMKVTLNDLSLQKLNNYHIILQYHFTKLGSKQRRAHSERSSAMGNP